MSACACARVCADACVGAHAFALEGAGSRTCGRSCIMHVLFTIFDYPL